MNNYYLGLDIGTDSVGYAVTDEYYMPVKKRGEPVMGVTTFEAANQSQERRAFRTARRRIDRRQQRVALLNEIFTPEISKLDPRFFIRRRESFLYRDETGDEFTLFCDKDFTDKDYYKLYPTIHHLINELMTSSDKHDIRLVYLACAWLVAHRGHFLFDVAAENVGELLDFNVVYANFREYLSGLGYVMPWPAVTTADDILSIMRMNTGVSRKQDAFKEKIYGGKKPAKKAEPESDFPYGREAIVKLLCGAKVKPEDVFQNGEYTELESVSLGMGDEDFARIIAEMGDEGELLIRLRALRDCVMLISTTNGAAAISAAKVGVYEQHKKDLAGLKKFVKKYAPGKYNAIFRDAGTENYTAYSYNVKSCREPAAVKQRAKAEVFSDYLKKQLKDIKPAKADEAFYNDMLTRLETNSFLPKQKNTDNRVIPQQLYRYELARILDNAEKYLPMLSRRDECGLTAKEKILSIFDFRIPYFVGPLNAASQHAWIVRKGEGRIYPWNFNALVDLDASENMFIKRMQNSCTYYPGAEVLPVKSLLYCRFTVLNEINNIKVNGVSIPVEVKQGIYTDLFCTHQRVTVKQIKEYLKGCGIYTEGDELTGIDNKINSSLPTHFQFRRLLESGTLTEPEVESIIRRAAYSEDKPRFIRWLAAEYPQISDADRKYIARLNLKEFGRLSAEFLTGIYSADEQTGEAFTIIDGLWNTNNNLMQLLSDRYGFSRALADLSREYYAEHPLTLSGRLDEMYVSNAVKRPIFRTLDICADIEKAMGGAPKKIFVEMARGAAEDQKNKRTRTRREQLTDLYKAVKTADARELEKQLADMGAMADNRLQSDKLFLYYLQMGKCAYTGQAIDLARLQDSTYNIDHIYPQSFVKDDSVLNNKVLVLSTVNGAKTNVYPVDAEIRSRMRPLWEAWKNSGLMTDEKFHRLTRSTGFTEEEMLGFINRQLVETRQSTKAVAAILKDKYPDAEIVYVKAGLVSEFRQEFDMIKCRSVNNLHHARDAYLNIVVGNVYSSKFTKNFNVHQDYNIQAKKLFTKPVKCGKTDVWQGETDIAKVRAVMNKNAIHVTRYSFCTKGGLFDQTRKKKGPGYVPLKAGMDPEKYGGYTKSSASFYVLVKYDNGKKKDVMFMPVELLAAERFANDKAFAEEYIRSTVASITGVPVKEAELLLNGRRIKTQTVISVDGLRLLIRGKGNGGKIVLLSLHTPLILGYKFDKYVKALESFKEKRKTNPSIVPDEVHDHISAAQNVELYDMLCKKLGCSILKYVPSSQYSLLESGKCKFIEAGMIEQIDCLLNIVAMLSTAPGSFDLTLVGGSKNAGAKTMSSQLSNWKKYYKDVRIVDMSVSGIYESASCNLLELL